MSALTPFFDTYLWCAQLYFLTLLFAGMACFAAMIFASMLGVAIEASRGPCDRCTPLPKSASPPYWLLLLYWQLRDHRRLGHADH